VGHCEGKVPNEFIFYLHKLNKSLCSNPIVNQAQWNIHDDEDPKKSKKKKKTLLIMNNGWKQFKTMLRKKYMKTGKNPVGTYPWLTQDVWEQFQAKSSTEEFKVYI